MSLEKLAYSIDSLAEATDLSRSSIYNAIRDNELVPVYRGNKPLISRTEAERWLDSLPTERRAS